MPNLAKKVDCCGCSACYSVCSFAAIQMQPDETGFLYPLVDYFKCRECGKCELVCPVLNLYKKGLDNSLQPKAFVAQHRDEVIRKQSTSGGAFSAIAENIISLGGVVFGASFDKDFVVRHTYTDSFEGLAKFRNSKYVQSEIANTFIECKKFLDEDRWVCFSGTPCQIYGLLGFLNHNYDKLVTVDVVCHSVPSPLIFKKYLDLQQKRHSGIEKIVFRDKGKGYSYSTMAFYDKNNVCIYRKGSESDLWFRSFLPGLCDRECCDKCKFQSVTRASDITIWDCFGIAEISRDFDDNQGTTSVVAWSMKGLKFIQCNDYLRKLEVSVNDFSDKLIRKNKKSIKVNHDDMYNDAHILEAKDFFRKYRPEGMVVKMKHVGREFLFNIHLYNLVKKLFG